MDIKFHMEVSYEERQRIIQKLTQQQSANVFLQIQPEMDVLLSDVAEEKRAEGGASLRCSMKGELDLELL